MNDELASVFTGDLGRDVTLREGTSDRQVWSDTFVGRYHVPPPDTSLPATVLDLGANIGLTAAHYRAMWPAAQVVAVEMDADCAALAERNAPGVTVKCCAVSANGGWGWYDATRLAEAFTFVRGGSGDASGDGVDGRKLVQSYTLRQLILRSFDVTPVDLVKMDVEGAEWGLLARGEAWAPLVKRLLLELHPAPDFPGVGAETMEQETANLVTCATAALRELGYHVATQHAGHPRAVWAWR